MAGPLAGVVLDRMDRKQIMIVSDLIRAVVALGFILRKSQAITWLLYLAERILLLASRSFTSADLPFFEHRHKEELHTANSLTQTTGWTR